MTGSERSSRIDFDSVQRALEPSDLLTSGRVIRITGNTIEALLPRAQTGSIYRIAGDGQRQDLLAEVIGFREHETILAPFGEPRGIGPGEPIVPEGLTDEQWVSDNFLSRVVDALGRPIDGGPFLSGRTVMPLYRSSPNPLSREPISEPLATGVSAIDSCITLGQGQRLGIFAGAGVGKSTLLGMLCRRSSADVNVVALVGERGREVKGFIEREIGAEAMRRSVVLVATGDMAPILRVRVAFLATTLAEYFRDRGNKVLLVMDSLTRFAHALREIGLAAGEPPTTRGYPPSVYSTMPKLLERAGNAGGKGSITAIYTVLVDGDDMNEPVSDSVRSILDGHIILNRKIAESGRYPAIDIPSSLSRIADDIIPDEQRKLATRVRQVYSGYEEIKDLVQVGAYKRGTDPQTDHLLDVHPKLNAFFNQGREEFRALEETMSGLEAVLGPSHADG